MVSQISYDRNARAFHVLCDGEFIGYAKSNFEAEQLQHDFREEVHDWNIGAAAIAEVYQRRYTAQTPYPQHRPVEQLCQHCGPTTLTIEQGYCLACIDHAARQAAEDARIAAIEAQADTALAQGDPATPRCADCGSPDRLVTHHEYDLDGVLVEIVTVCVPCHAARLQRKAAARAARWSVSAAGRRYFGAARWKGRRAT